nr:competence protein ComEA helix-hairpin-helix repeat region [Klebsiella pneumoniae]
MNKENVQASSSAKAEAVPGESDIGATKVSINRASAEQLAQALNGVGLKSPCYCQLPRRVRAVQNPR